MNRLNNDLPVDAGEVKFVEAQHLLRSERDIDGIPIHPFTVKLTDRASGAEFFMTCWAWHRSHARKILANELRGDELRGCDGVVL